MLWSLATCGQSANIWPGQNCAKYSFSTIAYRAMSCDVHHSKEYWMRKKRRALVESLDEELHTRDLLDPVSAAYENVLSFQELSGKLTAKAAGRSPLLRTGLPRPGDCPYVSGQTR